MKPAWVYAIWPIVILLGLWDWWRYLDAADRWLMVGAVVVIVVLVW